MVTFCGITAFTSTVIRGKDQSFCVHAMSRKVDSTALCSHQKKNTGEASAVSGRISSWQTERLLASSFCRLPIGPAGADESMPFACQSHQHSCKQTSRSQTGAVFTIRAALFSSFASICLNSLRKEQSVLPEVASLSSYQLTVSFPPEKSK